MSSSGKIFIANDHAGTSLKKALQEKLSKKYPAIEWINLGTNEDDSVHYPDFAKDVARKVREEKARGILICGSGIGMSIAANRFKGIRAANVWDELSAKLSREHNDANVLCLGARFIPADKALKMIEIFIETPFEGGRHSVRTAKMDEGDL